MPKKANKVTFIFDKQGAPVAAVKDGIEINVRDPATGETRKMLIPKLAGKCPACGQLIRR